MAPLPPPIPGGAAPEAAPPVPDPAGATIDLPLDDEAPPKRRGGRLGWLLAALFAVACAAVVGKLLDERARARGDLGTARDESAELRRELLQAQGKLQAAV